MRIVEKRANAKAERERGKATTWRARVRKTIFRPGFLVLLAVIASGWFLGPHFQRWSRSLETHPDYQFTLRDIRVTAANRWVPVDLVDQVLESSELPDQTSLLEPELLSRVADAFSNHPWVRTVIGVRADRPEGLRVELEYRRPVAMIATARGLYPIDVDGVLLPPADFSMSDAERLPLVTNVSTVPQGPAGTAWGDPVVAAAARLADLLAPEGDLFAYWDRYSLKEIVAPERRTASPEQDELDFELLTRGGSLIIWGQVPGADDLEPPVQQKLGRLDEYLATYGSFEKPRGPSRIDIREFDIISLEVLGESDYR